MFKVLIPLAALAGATGAGATVQTVRFAIAASDFADDNPSMLTPPVTSVTGTFAVTFDDAADVVRQTAGLTVSGFTLPYTGTIGFSYSKYFDGLSVGIETVPGGYLTNNNEFGFYVDQPTTDPNGSPLDFTYSTTQSSFSARSFTVTRLAATVPEPATWTLAVLGFGLIGGALRRRPVSVATA